VRIVQDEVLEVLVVAHVAQSYLIAQDRRSRKRQIFNCV
jgi:hypothetical protein